jgi:ABC-type nitrate/sulfonate/bicarbonate transport system permease component
MKKIFSPEFIDKVSTKSLMIIGLIQLALILIFSQFYTSQVLPKPDRVLHAMVQIMSKDSFLDNFVSTLSLLIKGMSIAILSSLFIVYISIIPAFRYVALMISKFRFLTYTGLVFVFTVSIQSGHDIKISLLLFGIIPFFVTSLMSYIKDIPQKEYELCYTLKFNKWETLYEVVIKGKLHLVIEVIRQNFAIAWMMICSVEGLSMAEGGLGTMMLKSNRVLKMNDVFAVLVIILLTGIFFDYMFSVLKVWFFPYTNTKRYQKLWINVFMKWLNKIMTTKTIVSK